MSYVDINASPDIAHFAILFDEEGQRIRRAVLYPEPNQWCEYNCTDCWEVVGVDWRDEFGNKVANIVVRFSSERDAILFKTFWH